MSVKVRPNTSDQTVVNEVKSYDRLDITFGDVVLDVGGNIGAFAVRAAQQGARVVTVEPDPDNFAVLAENIIGYEVRAIQAAVVGASVTEAEVPLYRTTTPHGQSMISSVAFKRRIKTAPVPAIQWDALLSQERFTVLKVDIESAEYGLDFSILPVTIKKIAIELHLSRTEWRYEGAPGIIKTFGAMGFVPTKAPHIGTSNWHTTSLWRRG